MSKRCDSQENYSGDLRKLLQQRINANRVKRETLSDEELHRLSKLEVILIALEEGEHVQNRQLKRWLTEDELARLEVLWEEQKSYREELKDKPSELKQYEEKLKKATFYANKAEGLRRKGNKQAVAANRSQCESLCEDALEILQEIVDADASLQIWFDRALDFSFGSHRDAQLGNLPHVVTSRSIDKQSGDSRIMSKQQVKIVVVEQASDALKYEYKSAAKADDVATDSSKLADFLKTL